MRRVGALGLTGWTIKARLWCLSSASGSPRVDLTVLHRSRRFQVVLVSALSRCSESSRVARGRRMRLRFGCFRAVGAAESGLCFGVRLRPAIHSPGGGAGAFTDSSKVRSRHTSLNSHVCRTLYTVPLSCVLLVAEDSQCGDLRVLTGAAGALRKGEYRVRHFAGLFASLV